MFSPGGDTCHPHTCPCSAVGKGCRGLEETGWEPEQGTLETLGRQPVERPGVGVGGYPSVSEHLWQNGELQSGSSVSFGVHGVPLWPDVQEVEPHWLGSHSRGPGASRSLSGPGPCGVLTACQASELCALSVTGG